MDNPYLRQNFSHRYRPLSSPPYPGKPNFYASHHDNSRHTYPYRPPPPPPPPHQPMPCPPPPHHTPPQHYFPAPRPPHPHPPYEPRRFAYTPPRVSQPSALSTPSSYIQFRGPSQSHWGLYREPGPDICSPSASRGYSHPFDHRSVTPDRSVDRFSQNLDDRYRFRDEFSGRSFERGAFGRGRILESHYSRGQVALGFDRSSRALGYDHRTRESNAASGHGMMVGFANDRENQILDDERLVRDSRGKMIDIAHSVIVSAGRDGNISQGSDFYSSEIDRYINNGSREVNHELSQSPWKHGPKKSVLLRLQDPKPKRRIRDDERLHNSGYFDERKSILFNCKDQLRFSDREMIEKQREATPVELDVSFKSNTLVAKAIKAPATADASAGMSVTPRSSKSRKVMRSDQNWRNSPSEGTTNWVSKMHISGTSFCVSKDSKHYEKNVADFGADNKRNRTSGCPAGVSIGKINLAKAPASTSPDIIKGAMVTDKDSKNSPKAGTSKVNSFIQSAIKPLRSDRSSEQSAAKGTSSGADIILTGKVGFGVDNRVDVPLRPSSGSRSSGRKVKVETSPLAVTQNKDDLSDAAKCPIAKVVKRKMIQKKGPEKASKICSKLTDTLRTKVLCKPVKEGSNSNSVSNVMQNEEGIKSLSENSLVVSLRSQPGETEESVLLETGTMKIFSEDPATVDVAINCQSGEACVTKILRKNNFPSAPLGSPYNANSRVDEAVPHSDNLSYEGGSGKSLTDLTISGMADVEDPSNHTPQNGDSLWLENRTKKGTPELSPNTRETTEAGISYAEENNDHHYLTDHDNILNEANSTINLTLQNGNVNPENGRFVTVSKHDTTDEGNPSVETSLEKGAQEAIPTKDCTVVLPSSGFAQAVALSNIRNYGLEKTFSTFNGLADSEGTIHKLDDNADKDVCMGEDAMLPKSGGVQVYSDVMSLQGSKKLALNQSGNRILTSQLKPSQINEDSMEIVNIKGSVDSLDAMVEVEGFIHGENSGANIMFLDTRSATCSDGGWVLHDSCLKEVNVEVSNVCGRSLSPATPVVDNRVTVVETFKPGSEMASDFNHNMQRDGGRLLFLESACPSELSPCPVQNAVLPKNCSGGGSLNSVAFEYIDMDHGQRDNLSQAGDSPSQSGNRTQDGLTGMGGDKGEKLLVAEERIDTSGESASCQIPGVDLCSDSGNSNNLGGCSLGVPILVYENLRNESPWAAGDSCPDEVVGNQSREGESCTDGKKEKVLNLHETPQCDDSVKHQCSFVSQSSTSTDVESEELPAFDYCAWASDRGGTVSEKLAHDVLDSASDMPTDIDSQEILRDANHNDTLDNEAACFTPVDQSFCGNENFSNNCAGDLTSCSTFSIIPDNVTVASDHLEESPLISASILGSKSNAKAMNSRDEVIQKTDYTSYTVPKSYSSSSFVSNTARNVASRTRSNVSRTWHRTGNTSAPWLVKPFSGTVPAEVALPIKAAVGQNAYIRKGNSLLRKPPAGAGFSKVSLGQSLYTSPANDTVVNEAKDARSRCRADASKTTQLPAPLARPSTPLVSGNKMPNLDVTSSIILSSPRPEHPADDCSETPNNAVESSETDVTNTNDNGCKTSETLLNQMVKSYEGQNEVNAASSTVGGITYIKRKSYQLVAAPNVCNASEQQVSSSDGYYKRRRNQLVRTSADSHINQAVSLSQNALRTRSRGAPCMSSSNKDATKSHKCSKSSLVWTSQGTGLTNNSSIRLHHKKMFPQLFPWKRPIYSRSYLGIPSVSSSLSSIGRKLLLLRKRDAIYTRSNHGYSLRKSKVLSVGRQHLKWSKSIERNSKKANEEATLAVAAAVKKKLEHCSNASGVSGSKTKPRSSRKLVHRMNLLPGERVYRIGSIRYKMDSSKRTLWRISDDESSFPEASLQENDPKKMIVPRRLLIGTDEYIRIGNGNQLVRDPKKRARALASEKVRWSLHTARMRLAKKRKYCQFFTRFGKCSKDDGKCPYIHDPSKITVCTKFLNGLCANPNCKLTHKVIPERMPDCSYFLQGLCTNEVCPYRHVHVNPKAATCEAFLRGYCADGNECQKKHSYMCPVFEATGTCPQGSKCKLHHPRKQGKQRKRKRSCDQRNTRGRYFESLQNNMAEFEPTASDGQLSKDAVLEGLTGDYISLDISEEGGGSNVPRLEQTAIDECCSELRLEDADELIKPIRIMTQKGTE